MTDDRFLQGPALSGGAVFLRSSTASRPILGKAGHGEGQTLALFFHARSIRSCRAQIVDLAILTFVAYKSVVAYLRAIL